MIRKTKHRDFRHCWWEVLRDFSEGLRSAVVDERRKPSRRCHAERTGYRLGLTVHGLCETP